MSSFQEASSSTSGAQLVGPPAVDTRTKLTRAAASEFIEHGYTGTDTNRIARRAGYAPQTFYRWFKDKADVFIQVYVAWEDAEAAILESMLTHQASSLQIAEACVESYRSFLLFRRHLRQLSIENAEVRAARAQCRWRQVKQMRVWNPALTADDEQIAARLIQLDLLSMALAEGEWADMGLQGHGGLQALADVIESLRHK
jgi:AcrR family transcriptional regulator